MAYFIREAIAGMVKEIEKWKKPTKEARKEAKRAAKTNATSEAQAKVNRENALRRLRLDINDNFKPGDYWLSFTYAREYAPTDEGCEADYKKLMRSIRKEYKRAGVEMKYISVHNQPGHRPHIHLLITKGVALENIQGLWPYSRIDIKLLDESGQYRALAEYIFKHSEEKSGGKRWNASKNLTHPQFKERKSSANSWREEPTIPNGWMLDKVSGIERGINPITGAEYQRYTLIKIPETEKGRVKNARVCAGDTSMRK